MLNFNNRKYYVYSSEIDMRFGIKKAQLFIYTNFSEIEVLKSLFIFVSKNRKIVKIYYENEYGYRLMQNNLSDQKFKIPFDTNNTPINKCQLEMFLKGMEVIEKRRKITENLPCY